MKLIKTSTAIAIMAIMTGCASVNMAPEKASATAKAFDAPEQGMSGLYIYRKSSPIGAGLKKDIWVNGECVGESASGVFFYHPVAGGEEYEIATESEFSPNIVSLTTRPGKNYFIQQYIKMGAFVGGANLRVITEQEGMEDIANLEMATKGNCSKELD